MMASRAVLVWGAGGHGRVVADAARAAGDRVIGYVDADPTKAGQLVDAEGGRVVCSEEALLETLARAEPLPSGADAVVVAIGDNERRLRRFDALRGVAAPALLHPRAVVSASVRIEPGSVVLGGAVINAGAVIGAASIINSGSVVEHDCVVGDGVHVSPSATLCGGVSVDRAAWVGAGATVLPGLHVGAQSIVAAGATVTRNVEAGSVVAGCPAIPLNRS